ncbi:MAG: molybdopterin-dependent oxidoreductase [Desulfobacterales bacterium]
MTTRREAIKLLAAIFAGTGAIFVQIGTGLRSVLAETGKRVLPKGTPMHILTGKNPANLDASLLEVTPLNEFETMGTTKFSIAPHIWRLEVTGAVERPSTFSYLDLIARPAVERNVLLICPGFFAFNGRWKGVMVKDLLAAATVKPGVTKVEFGGPNGPLEKTHRFPLEEAQSDRFLLAYHVNGDALPQKHGFPMRLVAEGHYGARWVKYVDRITAIAP